MTSTVDRRAMLLLLILSGVIISICMGLRQSLGISAATFGFAIALQNIVWGLSQPFVGAVADRYGARPVLIATSFIYAAGLALMVFAKTLPMMPVMSGATPSHRKPIAAAKTSVEAWLIGAARNAMMMSVRRR